MSSGPQARVLVLIDADMMRLCWDYGPAQELELVRVGVRRVRLRFWGGGRGGMSMLLLSQGVFVMMK